MPSSTAPMIPLNAKPIFEPIFGKIVIKVDQEPERMYGQLYMPQRSRDQTIIGKVYAVYPAATDGNEEIHPQVSIGDTVIFGQYTGTTINVNRDMFIICKEHDLLSIVRFPNDAIPDIEEVL